MIPRQTLSTALYRHMMEIERVKKLNKPTDTSQRVLPSPQGYREYGDLTKIVAPTHHDGYQPAEARRDPPLTNCVKRAEEFDRVRQGYRESLDSLIEAQLTEVSKLRKLGAILRAVSVLASAPDMSHHSPTVKPSDPTQHIFVTKADPLKDRPPQKKTGPQPLRRRS